MDERAPGDAPSTAGAAGTAAGAAAAARNREFEAIDAAWVLRVHIVPAIAAARGSSFERDAATMIARLAAAAPALLGAMAITKFVEITRDAARCRASPPAEVRSPAAEPRADRFRSRTRCRGPCYSCTCLCDLAGPMQGVEERCCAGSCREPTGRRRRGIARLHALWRAVAVVEFGAASRPAAVAQRGTDARSWTRLSRAFLAIVGTFPSGLAKAMERWGANPRSPSVLGLGEGWSGGEIATACAVAFLRRRIAEASAVPGDRADREERAYCESAIAEFGTVENAATLRGLANMAAIEGDAEALARARSALAAAPGCDCARTLGCAATLPDALESACRGGRRDLALALTRELADALAPGDGRARAVRALVSERSGAIACAALDFAGGPPELGVLAALSRAFAVHYAPRFRGSTPWYSQCSDALLLACRLGCAAALPIFADGRGAVGHPRSDSLCLVAACESESVEAIDALARLWGTPGDVRRVSRIEHWIYGSCLQAAMRAARPEPIMDMLRRHPAFSFGFHDAVRAHALEYACEYGLRAAVAQLGRADGFALGRSEALAQHSIILACRMDHAGVVEELGRPPFSLDGTDPICKRALCEAWVCGSGSCIRALGRAPYSLGRQDLIECGALADDAFFDTALEAAAFPPFSLDGAAAREHGMLTKACLAGNVDSVRRLAREPYSLGRDDACNAVFECAEQYIEYIVVGRGPESLALAIDVARAHLVRRVFDVLLAPPYSIAAKAVPPSVRPPPPPPLPTLDAER